MYYTGKAQSNRLCHFIYDSYRLCSYWIQNRVRCEGQKPGSHHSRTFSCQLSRSSQPCHYTNLQRGLTLAFFVLPQYHSS